MTGIETRFGVRVDGKIFWTTYVDVDCRKKVSKDNPNRVLVTIRNADGDSDFSVSIREHPLKKGMWVVTVKTENREIVEVEVKEVDIVF